MLTYWEHSSRGAAELLRRFEVSVETYKQLRFLVDYCFVCIDCERLVCSMEARIWQAAFMLTSHYRFQKFNVHWQETHVSINLLNFTHKLHNGNWLVQNYPLVHCESIQRKKNFFQQIVINFIRCKWPETTLVNTWTVMLYYLYL